MQVLALARNCSRINGGASSGTHAVVVTCCVLLWAGNSPTHGAANQLAVRLTNTTHLFVTYATGAARTRSISNCTED